MKKQLLSFLLVLCMTLTLLPAEALAMEIVDSDSGADAGQEASEWPEDILEGDPVGTPEVFGENGISDVDISSVSPEEESQNNWYGENGQFSTDASLYSVLGTGPATRGTWISELVALFGLTVAEYPDVYFPDIEGTAYYDAVMTATMCGLIDVEAGDNFEPDGALTQGFAVKTLNYRLGLQPGTEAADPDGQVAVERGWFGGTYAADALVTAEQSAAMLSDARSILASRVAPTPVSNYQFADYVVIVPDTAEVSVQGGTVQITGFTGIAQGTVFAFYEQGLAFAYTANYVDQQGATLFITTAPAPEDAVISAEFAGEIVPELTFIPDENVVTLMDSDGQPVVFGAAREVDKGKDYIKISRSITLGDGVTGSLNINLTNIKLETQFFGSIKSFILVGDLDVSATVKMSLDDKAAKELALGEIGLGSFGYVALAINLELEAKMSYTYTAEFGLGVEFYDWSFHNISYCTAKGSSLSAEGKASAHLSY